MDKNKFLPVTRLVINKLEGGYFHPDMRTANPKKFGVYHRSGETMFGLDRHAGHSIYYSTPIKRDSRNNIIGVIEDLQYIENGSYKYKTPEAREFWELIDNADARHKWKWLYRGGDLETRLTDLTSRIMYPVFLNHLKIYLKDPIAEKIIESDPRLMLNFIYAVWNGSGWFLKFATDFKKAIKRGITDPDRLVQVVLDSRIKEGLKTGEPPVDLIVKGGKQLKEIFKTLKGFNDTDLDTNPDPKKKINYIVITLVAIAGYFLYKKYKK